MYQTFPTPFTDGDTLPELVGSLPFDLTGHLVTLRIQTPSGMLEKTATITSATSTLSAFVFEWEDGDIVTGARQLCQLSVLTPAGKLLTAPRFAIDVEARL